MAAHSVTSYEAEALRCEIAHNLARLQEMGEDATVPDLSVVESDVQDVDAEVEAAASNLAEAAGVFLEVTKKRKTSSDAASASWTAPPTPCRVRGAAKQEDPATPFRGPFATSNRDASPGGAKWENPLSTANQYLLGQRGPFCDSLAGSSSRPFGLSPAASPWAGTISASPFAHVPVSTARRANLFEGVKEEKPYKCVAAGCVAAFVNAGALAKHVGSASCPRCGPARTHFLVL